MTGLALGANGFAYGADMVTKAPPPPPPVAVPGWTGWYIGGSLGYGWGDASVGIASGTPVLAALITVGSVPTSLTTDPDGWLTGLQLGYNYQIDKLVLGVEADFSLTDISGNAAAAIPGAVLPFALYTTSAEQRLDWLGTLRGRVGFMPIERLLVYGTGGLAFGRTDDSANIRRSAILLNFTVPASESLTQVGWTAGAGVEYALTNKWSVKAEYLYYDLGSATLTGNETPPPLLVATRSATYTFTTSGSIVRLGVNLKLN